MKIFLIVGLITFTLVNYAASQTASNKTVKIGNQVWMSENLNVATFSNGDKIHEVRSSAEWIKYYTDGKPAWCYYNFKSENGKKYGKLYNWFAVSDKRGLAPKGWRVSTLEDWSVLSQTLGNEDVAAKKLRNKTGWKLSGNGTNEVGFNGLPGGSINAYGMFGDIGFWGTWWCYDNMDAKLLKGKYLKHDSDMVEEYASYMKTDGLSVRCVKEVGE